MHKNATKCNKTQSKWCINKHGASKIIDTFETYQDACLLVMAMADDDDLMYILVVARTQKLFMASK
jgi:hypothetical protein